MENGIKVAIQGGPGSFHEEMAHKMLKNPNTFGKPTFKEVFESLKNDEVDCAVIAVENENAGIILDNYKLLVDYAKDGIVIAKEAKLRIKQCLIGLPGAKIEDISTIISHPVALQQCSDFVGNYKQESYHDTADAVKYVMEQNDSSYAAIASQQAAKIHGGKILEKGIQNEENNKTRFVLLNKKKQERENVEKSSLALYMQDGIGVLMEILKILDNGTIDIGQINSINTNQNGKKIAVFYVDCNYESRTDFNAAVSELGAMERCLEIKRIGDYPIGKIY